MKKIYPLFVVIMIGIAAATAFRGVKAIMLVYRRVFPDVALVQTHYPVADAKIANRIVYRFQKARPKYWRRLGEIPKKAVAAILMSEDSGFFNHPGYDVDAIRAAWEHNRKPGVKIKRGASTITQQVVKNLFLTPEKTIIRKLRELLLAVELERKVSKTRILETYLNIAEWGPNTFGIEQASWRYFKKPADKLTAREGAILAFMLPNPIKYERSIRPVAISSEVENESAEPVSDYARQRVGLILERLWKTGHISDDEYSSAADLSEIKSHL